MKIGSRKLDRLLHAPHVQVQQQQRQQDFETKFGAAKGHRQQGKQRVDAARYRDGDREHIVDDQSAAGHEARVRPEQAGRDLVTAAAIGKQLDDLVVRHRDYEHGDGRHCRKVETQRRVRTQREKRFLGTVAGGRQTVGAEADPGNKGHQGHVLARLAAERIECLSQQRFAPTTRLLHTLLPRLHRRSGPACGQATLTDLYAQRH